MQVFDLTEVQATYILDMPLRRLTKFSKLELDKEQAELRARRSTGSTRSSATTTLLRKVVSDELADVAKTYGTPRRTVLLASAGQPVSAAVPLEVADDPCFVYLSSSGLLARTTDVEPPGEGGGRAKHDVVVSAVRATARGQVGALTSAGPAGQARRARPARPCPATANAPAPAGRRPGERVPLPRGGRAGARAWPRSTDGRARLRARHPAGRRQAGQPRGARQPGRLGGGPARRRRRGGRAPSSCAPARRSCASSPPTPSCCTSRAAAVRPQGRSGRRHRRRPARRRASTWSSSAPSRPATTRVVVTVSGLVDRAARHRGRRGQGHAVRGVPRQGPRHRRRALPPVPQGRGHPGVRLGRAAGRPRAAARQRRAGRPARRPTGRRDGSGVPASQPIVAAAGPP